MNDIERRRKMSFINLAALFVFLIWVFIKTVSYGKWTWNNKNRLGAIVIVVIALASLILPIYSIYFRE